jgi:alkaline phosphatase D
MTLSSQNPFPSISRAVALCRLGFALAGFVPFTGAYDVPPEPDRLVSRIAFGSCNSPTDASPIWESVLNTSPDVWIWLGDTVYGDSPRPAGATPEIRAAQVLERQRYLYDRQNALPAYRELRTRARVIGTWDDHDYGENDAGAAFVGRDDAQKQFLDFYGEPVDSARRDRPGIYASYRFGPPGRTVQIIVLDTRYFRSPLRIGKYPSTDALEGRPGNYDIANDPATTLLGDAQWRWLEAALQQPADVRIVASSIQVIADDHRFEKWGNFPHERRRLFKLLRDTGAHGVIFISGDRHTGELSRLDPAREPDAASFDPGYPLYDLTSSALNHSVPTTYAAQLEQPWLDPVAFSHEINRHRVGSRLPYNHFGLITIDWNAAAGAELTLALHLDHGREVLRQRVRLADLQPARQRR